MILPVPFVRTTLFDPGTRNISEQRGSRTMFRKLSMRLLPAQSGKSSVFGSSSATTGPSSPRGVASVPSGPTELRMQNLAAPIQARYSGVIRSTTLASDVGTGWP